jgi:DNA-binding transcriptional MerR regulator
MMHLGINTDNKKIYMPHALPGANNGGNVAYNKALKRNHEERNEAILELREAGWSNEAIHEILLKCGWHIEQAASINTIARLYQIRKQKRQDDKDIRAKKKAEAKKVAPEAAKPPRHPQVDELINIIEQWPAIAPTLLELIPIARDAEKWRIAQVFFNEGAKR